MPDSPQLYEDYFSKIDPHLRKASVAQIGGFRPPEDPVTSWFGGGFVSLPGEDWPSNRNGPMIPLLQARIDELPYKPDAVDDIALLNVFMDSKSLPIDTEPEGQHGRGWLIRTYESLDGLTPVTHPGTTFVKPFPIKWLLNEKDPPTGEYESDFVDIEFDNEQAFYEAYSERYPHIGATKFGGWPEFIQPRMNDEGYVFQIGSEEKPNWMWGDNGNGYFFRRDDGQWSLLWDCY